MEYVDTYEEAAHAPLSTERALQLAQDTDLACALALRDDLPSLGGVVHSTLVNHHDWFVPYTMAKNPALTLELVGQLAAHPHYEVAGAIAQRAGIGDEATEALLNHPDHRVRIQALRRSDIPMHLLAESAGEGSMVAQQRILNTPAYAGVTHALSEGARLSLSSPTPTRTVSTSANRRNAGKSIQPGWSRGSR